MFGENLRAIRNMNNYTMDEVVSKVNQKYDGIIHINKGNLSKWENDKAEPMLSTVRVLADFYGLCVDDLVHGNFDNIGKTDIIAIYNELNQQRKEKVYSYAEQQLEKQNKVISMEETGFEDEYVGQTAAGLPIEGQQPIPFVGAETVSLLVNGDSMEGVFSDGDIIEYHPQPELENGEIGVFAVNGGITLKKFKKNGDIRLESLNKKYQDIIIKETDDFNILGKVIL